MEAILTRPVQEGEQEKTFTEIVSQVLSESSTFLRNVGLKQTAAPKSAEKEESAGLQQKLQRLEAHAEESEAKSQKQAEQIDKQAEQIDILKKATVDTQNLVRQMIEFG
ncbi:hypothetical protein PVAP13_7NG018778 [Panicum virgatum]|uniref:Uncharacterized protein n=1 Tax=Panicum virgatum TaxID=38727 RepID=A0A8T0PVC6_PANVG|nr:hypothetical protein PVAP13_7NG018778 [Panicum virgatum]